jgi:hypothetical protein
MENGVMSQPLQSRSISIAVFGNATVDTIRPGLPISED